MSRKNSKSRRAERRQQAEERNAKWAAMTPAQQLADLDFRLGKDVGATKQRLKLKKKMEK